MRISSRCVFTLGFCVCACGWAAQQGTAYDKTLVRGWLSDEQCARGRAEAGTYTATNLSCARKCVAAGKRIVLIDADNKRILTIENQDAARRNLGDYVEIAGVLDPRTTNLRIASLRFLDKNRAMCSVPAKTKKQAN
jgi:hypothetical protein